MLDRWIKEEEVRSRGYSACELQAVCKRTFFARPEVIRIVQAQEKQALSNTGLNNPEAADIKRCKWLRRRMHLIVELMRQGLGTAVGRAPLV